MNKGKCQTKRCRNDAKDKNRSKYCYKCQDRKRKKKNPFMYHYNAMKQNAKRRGKTFELSFDEYKGFVVGSGMINPDTGLKDPFKTIDRKRPEEGYKLDNIQVLTLSQNSRKRWVDYYRTDGFNELTEEERAFWDKKGRELDEEIENELPF